MVSDTKFYSSFFEDVLGVVDNLEDAKQEDGVFEIKVANEEANAPRRMKYLLHQLDIIPIECRKFYEKMMRAHPTSPLYIFLIVGVLGTNMAR